MTKISLEQFTFDSTNIDAKGFLHCENCIFGRVGVLDYFRGGKNYKVLIRPETMEKALDSLVDLDITNDHPKGQELLTADNFRKLTVGNVSGKPIFEDGCIKGSLVIKDSSAIKEVVGGKTELSLGYIHDRRELGGEWLDEFGVMGKIGESYSYDAETTNIVYNHISIVDKGRAGIAKISFDSADEFTDYTSGVNNSNNENLKKMVSILIGNRTVEISKDDAAHVESFLESSTADRAEKQKTIDGLLSEKDQAAEKLASLEGKKIGLEASLKTAQDAAEAAAKDKVSMDADLIKTEVEKRIKTWAMVGSEVAFDAALTDADIKKAYVAAKLPKLNLDGRDESFIEGVFSTLPQTSKTIQELRSQDSMEVKTSNPNGSEDLDQMNESGVQNNGEQVGLDAVAAKLKAGRDAVIKDKKNGRISFSLNKLNTANKSN